MDTVLIILLIAAGDILFGLLWYGMLFCGDNKVGPVITLDEFKFSHRVLIRLSFIVFWGIYFVIWILFSFAQFFKDIFDSIFE